MRVHGQRRVDAHRLTQMMQKRVFVIVMVMPDHRLQLRPGPVMQYGEALADDADELLERLIAPGDDFGARVLGHMDRQRAVRGKHAEMPRLNQHLRRALYDGGDFTRGEAHIRRLGDAKPFAAAIVGDAEPRRIRLRAFDAPQQLKEILSIGQPANFGLAHAFALGPRRCRLLQ